MKITLTICLLLAFFGSFGQISRSNTFDIRDSMRINSIWYKQIGNVTATLLNASQIPAITGNTVKVTDRFRGGDFTVHLKSEGYSVDSGLVFPMSNSSYVLVRNMASNIAINVKWFGLVGDSLSDETVAYRRLRNFMESKAGMQLHGLYFPHGQYRITDTVTWHRGNLEIFGEGDSSIIVRDFPSANHTTCGVLTWESAALDKFYTGIYVHDIKLEGNANILFHDQWGHLAALYGTKGTRFERVTFDQFRGDGLYIGAGRTGNQPDIRTNENVWVINCTFDGGDCKNNRNGISIISNKGFWCTDSWFRNIGNDSLSFSVGPIDFERNNDYWQTSNNVVRGCHFINNNSVNTSCVTMFASTPLDTQDNATNWTITENTFEGNYWDIIVNNFIDWRPKNAASSNVKIYGNHHIYGRVGIRAAGRGIWIQNEDFKGNTLNYSGIQLGIIAGRKDLTAEDVWVDNCIFDSTGQNGGIEIYSGRFIHITNNTKIDRRPFLYLYVDATNPPGAPYRKLDNLEVVGNTMKAPAMDDRSLGTTAFINAPVGFNTTNFFINGNSTIRNNHLGGRVVLFQSGTEFYANGTTVTHPPTVGSWDAGNELFYTPNGDDNNNKLMCTTGGTFPMAGDTALNTFTAIDNSNYLAYTRGTNVQGSKLREGQYVYINSDSSARYKIIGTKDTMGIYLDRSVSIIGADTLHWIAPTFRMQSILNKYTFLNDNAGVLPGNQNEFVQQNLSNRVITLYYDATTLPGIEKSFYNNTTGDEYIYMGIKNDNSDTVKINSSTDSIRLFPKEQLRIVSSAANRWEIMDKSRIILERDVNPLDIFYNKGKVSLKGTGGLYVGDNGGAGVILNKRITSDSAFLPSVSNLIAWTDNSSGSFFAGGLLLKARVGHYFMVNGGSAPKVSANVNNLGHWSFNGLTTAGANAYADFRNPDSLGILLPSLSRNTFAPLTAVPGLIAYGNTLNKIIFMGAGGVIKPLLDSATAEGIYQHFITATYPLQFSGNVVSLDTGRGVSQIVTGGDLNKVRDSVITIINATNAGSGLMFPITSATIGAPTASSTSYYGLISAVSSTSTPDRNRVYVPINATLKKVYLFFFNGGTLSSAEASSFYIRVNNTTDFLISNAVTNNSVVTSFNNTAMSVSLNAGDYFEIKWVQAAWTTPPTNVRVSAVVWIQ